jgi:hypothetical protein
VCDYEGEKISNQIRRRPADGDHTPFRLSESTHVCRCKRTFSPNEGESLLLMPKYNLPWAFQVLRESLLRRAVWPLFPSLVAGHNQLLRVGSGILSVPRVDLDSVGSVGLSLSLWLTFPVFVLGTWHSESFTNIFSTCSCAGFAISRTGLSSRVVTKSRFTLPVGADR